MSKKRLKKPIDQAKKKEGDENLLKLVGELNATKSGFDPMTGRPTTDDEWWESIAAQFDLWRDIFNMPFESKSDATGKKGPRINHKRKEVVEWCRTTPTWDDEVNEGCREDYHIPYNASIDQTELCEIHQLGNELVPRIREAIEKRELTMQFLSDWGCYQSCVGALRIIIRSDSNPGHDRSALAGGRKAAEEAKQRQRWFAHYYLRYHKGYGSHDATAKIVEKFINAIVDGEIPVPNEPDVSWYEEFLDLEDKESETYCKLKPAYSQKELPVPKMKKLIELGAEGLPPTDIEFSVG